MIDISTERKEKGISQEKLAKEIGVSVVTINNWEHGKCTPSTKNMVKIAKYFGKTVEEIVK